MGGGLAGLSAGVHMGPDSLVLEKTDYPGGLCRSYKSGPYLFDFSGHLLHPVTTEGKSILRRFLGNNMMTHRRRAVIHFAGRRIPYPFQASIRRLPASARRECITGYILAASAEKRADPVNFAQWVTKNLGDGIGRHFMIPYNEKLWATSAEELGCDWMGQYVPDLDPRTFAAGAWGTSTRQAGYNAVFSYPRHGGIDMLPRAMAAELGKRLLCRTPANDVDLRHRIVRSTRGRVFKWNRMVLTIPLPVFFSIAHPVPVNVKRAVRALRWTSVTCLNLGIAAGARRRPPHWIYYPERQYPFYRAGFYSSFNTEAAPAGHRAAYIEISQSSGRVSARIIRKSLGMLQSAGILEKGDRVDHVDPRLMQHSYVIYNNDRKPALKVINRFLEKNGIVTAGRYARWEYSAMEEALLQGAAAAEISENGHDDHD